jgi:hypothetical protein
MSPLRPSASALAEPESGALEGTMSTAEAWRTINPLTMKASKVAAAITEELRKMPWGTFDNPRYAYRDASGRRCRSVLIKDPVANLALSGQWITINYAPHRDEGKRLSINQARRYLAWLLDGGAAPHWEFFEETGEHHIVGVSRARAGAASGALPAPPDPKYPEPSAEPKASESMPLWTVGILTDSMQARPFTEEETEARKAKRFTLRAERVEPAKPPSVARPQPRRLVDPLTAEPDRRR